MVVENLACFNCDSIPKYKCPNCRTPYCSVKCYQQHKTVSCTKPESPQKKDSLSNEERKINYNYPTEDTLPLETLENLRHSSGLKECLNNPHLREIMSAIDKSPNPTDLISQAMIEPIFVEFANECLKVVQPPEKEEVFSSDEDL